MPITFDINKKRGFMISTWTGDIDDKVFVDSYIELIKNNKDWTPGLHHIADIKGDLSKVTGKGIRDLAALINKYTVRDMKGRTNRVAAIVHDKKAEYVTRIYSAFFNKTDRDIEIFDNITEALEWLNRDPRLDNE